MTALTLLVLEGGMPTMSIDTRGQELKGRTNKLHHDN